MKNIRKLLALLLALISLSSVSVLAAEKITVNTDVNVLVENVVFEPLNANGECVMIIEYQGTTYAPLRALAEAYGLDVGYDAEKRTATVVKGDGKHKTHHTNAGKGQHSAKCMDIAVNTDMQILVDGNIFTPKNANGECVLVFEFEGTTYAPLRALAEAYGLEVSYNHEQRVVCVNSPKQQENNNSNNTSNNKTNTGSQEDTKKDTKDTQEETKAATVYITKTGKRYHYSGTCNGGTYYKSTLADALKRGLTPCQKCVD